MDYIQGGEWQTQVLNTSDNRPSYDIAWQFNVCVHLDRWKQGMRDWSSKLLKNTNVQSFLAPGATLRELSNRIEYCVRRSYPRRLHLTPSLWLKYSPICQCQIGFPSLIYLLLKSLLNLSIYFHALRKKLIAVQRFTLNRTFASLEDISSWRVQVYKKGRSVWCWKVALHY